MKLEVSCGAVLYTKINNEIKYVIIKSIEGFYGFPKGHQEENETEYETALREIKEEVGIDAIIDEGFRIEEEYFMEKKKAMKKVVYFVATYTNQTLTYQKEELENVTLMSYEQAMNVFDFESSKNVLTKAKVYIESKNSN